MLLLFTFTIESAAFELILTPPGVFPIMSRDSIVSFNPKIVLNSWTLLFIILLPSFQLICAASTLQNLLPSFAVKEPSETCTLLSSPTLKLPILAVPSLQFIAVLPFVLPTVPACNKLLVPSLRLIVTLSPLIT